jgi:photosynthetic reaction center cytochrome c subunit
MGGQSHDLLTILSFLMITTCSDIVAQSVTASGAGEITEPIYKNVQVLKDIPSSELIPAMQFITASLGVECSFCHVEGHFDSDDKKAKHTAREMIRMMKAINQDHFEGRREVTCNTCHRGQHLPSPIPDISEKALAATLHEASQPRPPDPPSADQLLRNYLKAVGGTPALLRLSTRAVTGTADFAGRKFPVLIYDKAPYKRALIIHLPGGDSTTSFDGQHGWLQSPGRPAHEMSKAEIEGTKMDADLKLPLHLRDMFPELKPAPSETIGGHDTYQLVAEKDGQPRLRLYFDQQTGLLRRLERYQDCRLGLNPVRVDYEDYRPVDGVQVPHRWIFSRPSGQFKIEANQIDQGVPIDDARFAQPASAPREQAPSKP